MSATTEHVFIEALSLPTKARAALAHKLLTSLEHDDLSVAIEEAWKLEALDRCKAYDEGQLTERDADAVMRDLAAKLK
jgi:hypothetical protein